MLPQDLFCELLTLLDDASTYRTFALASCITFQLCQKDEPNAKKRFTMLQKDDIHTWYQLPNATQHGPELSYRHTYYVCYLNGKREGVYWEWFSYHFHPGGGRYVLAYYRNDYRHGIFKRWTQTGEIVGDRYYVDGVMYCRKPDPK